VGERKIKSDAAGGSGGERSSGERRAAGGGDAEARPESACATQVAGAQPSIRGPDTKVAPDPTEQAAPAPAAPASPSKGWRTLLAGASPREVLARLMCGDPLALRPRISAALDEGAYLIEHDLLHLRVVARIARAAPRYRGQPELDAWLRRHVAEALAELVTELTEATAAEVAAPRSPRGDGAGARADDEGRAAIHDAAIQDGPLDRGASDPGLDAGLAELARPLGLEPAAARAACRAFNRLGFEERSAFRALVLEGRTLDELAASSGKGATEIARAARRALERVCAAAAVRVAGAPPAAPTRSPSRPAASTSPSAASPAPAPPTQENRR
jgi:DNA-directed RNA polymerase specialized sigma24 family protein